MAYDLTGAADLETLLRQTRRRDRERTPRIPRPPELAPARGWEMMGQLKPKRKPLVVSEADFPEAGTPAIGR